MSYICVFSFFTTSYVASGVHPPVYSNSDENILISCNRRPVGETGTPERTQQGLLFGNLSMNCKVLFLFGFDFFWGRNNNNIQPSFQWDLCKPLSLESKKPWFPVSSQPTQRMCRVVWILVPWDVGFLSFLVVLTSFKAGMTSRKHCR